MIRVFYIPCVVLNTSLPYGLGTKSAEIAIAFYDYNKEHIIIDWSFNRLHKWNGMPENAHYPEIKYRWWSEQFSAKCYWKDGNYWTSRCSTMISKKLFYTLQTSGALVTQKNIILNSWCGGKLIGAGYYDSEQNVPDLNKIITSTF